MVSPDTDATASTRPASASSTSATESANLPTTGSGSSENHSNSSSSTSDNTTGTPPLDSPHDNTCDVFAQDCKIGEKCVPWDAAGDNTWNNSKCVAISGDGAPGEPCTAPSGPVAGIDDCAAGSICWDVDENNHGICTIQCSGSAEAPICPANHRCTIYAGTYLSLCFLLCHPLVDPCPDNSACIPGVDAFYCGIGAWDAQNQVNAPCSGAGSCDKGLACIDPLSAPLACDSRAFGCCQPFCKFPDGDCPNPDQQCLSWYPPRDTPPGYSDLGICFVPA